MEKQLFEPLVNLLDDRDEEVYRAIYNELIRLGTPVIQPLEQKWETTSDGLIQDRIENIISTIHFRALQKDFSQWLQDYTDNLLFGSYLIARFQYPDLRYQPITNFVDEMAAVIAPRLDQGLTPIEKTRVINKVFFKEYGFSANTANIFSPRNCYINRLTETRQGNAVTLSIMYMSVTARLSVPVYGINLPNNFVMAYMDTVRYGNLSRDNLHFYIDPLGKGMILSRQDINHFISRLKLTPHESFFSPCSNLKIIQRLLSTLILCLDRQNESGKTEQLKELFSLLSIKVAKL